ncbi:MAG TPA: OsmC family protein, partial [Planctomycetota bacterium]|nr:OsmC family protein [Planctomycetota bacterium]
MVTITARYDGDLSCTATHGPSGATIRTDAPKDNEGTGRLFSPTDLVGTAMGTCMLTIMGIVARRHGIAMDGATVKVDKHMSQNPRRIGRLPVEITVPGRLQPEQKRLLEAAALGCP